MNPLVTTMLQPMLAKIDVLHLLQVLTGADQPSPSEYNTLETLQRLLATPFGGDMAWSKAAQFLKDQQFDTLALSYLKEGLDKRSVAIDVPLDILSAKPALEQLLSAVLNDPEIHHVGAITQCPNCEFLYGVAK